MPGVVAGVLGIVSPLSAGVVGTVGVGGAVYVGEGVEVLGPLRAVLGPLGPLGPFEMVPVGGVVAKRVFTPAVEPLSFTFNLTGMQVRDMSSEVHQVQSATLQVRIQY